MFEFIAELIKTQPVLAGMGGATAAGVVLSHAKELPGKVWNGFTDQFSVSLTIHSEDQFFELFERWLSRQPSTKRMRRLRLAEWYDRAKHGSEFGIAPGNGLHIIWKDGRPFFFYRETDPSQGEYRKRKQTITVRTPGRDQTPILDLLDQVRNVENIEEVTAVYHWNGTEAWRIDDRPKRSMDTVYLDPALKSELIGDLTKFLDSRESYARRGTPWRRGYCFTGAPGTGKTTTIFALASLFNKAVYIIPLSAIGNDKELLNAINAGGSAWVVLEDVDSVKATAVREPDEKIEAVRDTNTAGITRSGLLNAIDGIGAREGRVLFMTTNHPEIIDGAFMRPGRIDMAREFPLATIDEAKAMFARFYGDVNSDDFVAEINQLLPMTQAALQNWLLLAERSGAPSQNAVIDDKQLHSSHRY